MLGCCDLIIASRNSNIGMGGPAMIESGGLGIFRPEQVGPIEVQVPSGVVDIAVADGILFFADRSVAAMGLPTIQQVPRWRRRRRS